jgi:hypothetical protein
MTEEHSKIKDALVQLIEAIEEVSESLRDMQRQIVRTHNKLAQRTSAARNKLDDK